jgi:hypothetical protein
MSHSTRLLLAIPALLVLGTAGARAQDTAQHDHSDRPMGPGMMGPGKGGMGMCARHGGGPMGLSADADQIKVENLKDGVRITLTATDAKAASRLQKRAEILRLQHELREEE